MPVKDCRYFNGYKPCGRHDRCDERCPHLAVTRERILIIHLEALGAVLRSTALLPAIQRRYPESHITWLTSPAAKPLLENLPQVDRVLTTTPTDLLQLSALEFDVAFCVDKSLTAAGVLRQTRARQVFGFNAEPTGAIVPATRAANELWELGLSNQKKFFENQKTENQLVCEALELPYARDEYQVVLSAEEEQIARERRQAWAPQGEILIGLNTGCAGTIPYKKLTIETHRELAARLSRRPGVKVALLGGGSEDHERNVRIAQGLDVIFTPTLSGLRDGLCSMAAMDLVITGDSLGMHMAIGLKKWVVAWFGPTCAQEIDFYDRGAAILTKAPCAPCWKRMCQRDPMCYDLVDIGEILTAIDKGIQWHISSSKQPSSATSCSPVPS